MAQTNRALLEAKTGSNIGFPFLLLPPPCLACGHGDSSLMLPVKRDSNLEMKTAAKDGASEVRRQRKTEVLTRLT